MSTHYNIVGAGIGPFHLSLAAMLEKIPKITPLFLDQRAEFRWHPEILHHDADMQTSFYKDFVTPVDPTSRHSFLNYLVEHGLFYAFMNTGRQNITRLEFEQYGRWVAGRLENLKFNTKVREVTFEENKFVVKTDSETFTSDHFSFATGATPYVPECAKPHEGRNVFHPKSGKLEGMNVEGKRIVIVGGGQTGVEIFRNILHGKWGRPQSVKLITKRKNLEPLDESPFTNEYFTPGYNEEFFPLGQSSKEEIVASQKLASDGNTPVYLELLYKDLYLFRHVMKNAVDFEILPKRTLVNMTSKDSGYELGFTNAFNGNSESLDADIVILSTGFKNNLPEAINGLKDHISFDEKGRLHLERSFKVKTNLPVENKLFALNFSRHSHGISEPQTSLMAWRSAMIANEILGDEFYKTTAVPGFLTYGSK